MRSLFFAAVLFSLFSVISFTAIAQKRMELKEPIDCAGSMPFRFIEGIEISTDVNRSSLSTVAPQHLSKNNTGLFIEKELPVQFKFAQLLDRNVEEVNNISLFNFIDQWWETRYRYGGHTKSGIDCSAFTATLFNDVYHLRLPRTAREQFKDCEKIGRQELSEGDLVFFNTRGGVSHVGCYLVEGYFVHASTGNGVTISNLADEYYSNRFISGGRVVNYCTEDVCLEKL